MSDTLFCGAALEEYQYRNDNRKPLLIGREPENSKEIMISDYMLRKFGVTDNIDDIVGQTVSFYYEAIPVFLNVIITGIVDVDYFREFGTFGSPEIWTRRDSSTMNMETEGIYHFFTIDEFKNYAVVTDRYLDLKNVEELRSFYFSDKRYVDIVEPCNQVTSMKYLINRIGGLFGIMIILSLILHLYNIFTQRATDRMQFNGILRAMGLRRGGILQIGFYELMYISLVAVSIGVMCSVGLIYVLNEYVGALIMFRLELDVMDFIGVALIALGILLLLMFFMQYIILRNYLRKQPIELLRS